MELGSRAEISMLRIPLIANVTITNAKIPFPSPSLGSRVNTRPEFQTQKQADMPAAEWAPCSERKAERRNELLHKLAVLPVKPAADTGAEWIGRVIGLKIKKRMKRWQIYLIYRRWQRRAQRQSRSRWRLSRRCPAGTAPDPPLPFSITIFPSLMMPLMELILFVSRTKSRRQKITPVFLLEDWEEGEEAWAESEKGRWLAR